MTTHLHSIAAGSASPQAGGFRRRLLAIAATLACLGSAALAVDLPVARWFKGHRPPSEINRLLNLSEAFAHGTGVAVILLVAAVLDPSLTALGRPTRGRGGMRSAGETTTAGEPMAESASARGPLLRRLTATDLFRLVAAAYAGGLVVDVIKAVVDRVRPRAADLHGTASALATFGEQAAAWAREQAVTSASDLNSFPSGHSATAAGLAAALSWKYPRGAWAFAALAVCGASQRVVSLAHYPSDACLGLAIGLAAAALLLGDRPGSTAAG
jgi:membrane-associated phospholipid phosphatase